MQNYAINNNLTPFISMQNHHSLIYREEEREMSPTLKHFGVSAIPWSSLGRGLLCRPYKSQTATKRGETDWFLKNWEGSTTALRLQRGRDCKEEGRQHGTSCHRLGGFQRCCGGTHRGHD